MRAPSREPRSAALQNADLRRSMGTKSPMRPPALRHGQKAKVLPTQDVRLPNQRLGAFQLGTSMSVGACTDEPGRGGPCRN